MDPNNTDQLADAKAGWQCVRLLAMTRTALERAARLEAQLQPFDPSQLNADLGAALTAAQVACVVAGVIALQDGVDGMAFVASQLRGRDDSLVVSHQEVRAEAARALATGSSDRSSVFLATATVSPSEGFPALAEALGNDPGFIADWHDVTIRELLGTFRDSESAQARRVCLTALLHPDTPLSRLDLDAIRRLADALRGTDA